MNYNKLQSAYIGLNTNVSGVYDITIPKGSYVEDITTLESVCGILIPISGKALYKVNNTKYQLDKSTVLHAGPSMSLSKYVGDKDWHYILIHYKVTGEKSHQDLVNNFSSDISINNLQQEQIFAIASKMNKLHNQSNNNNQLLLKSMLIELLNIVVNASKQNPIKTDREKIDFVKVYIQTHLHKLDSVEKLGNLVDMPLKRFSYLFTKMNGVSPKKYINKMKIRVAEEKLINTDKTMVDIAYDIGYEDVFYFSRFFKKQTGFSPTEFRSVVGKSPS